MRKIKELKGLKSLRALNSFHMLMFGLKMLPDYLGETYEDFFLKIDSMSEKNQEKVIRKAALFVDLKEEELESLVYFATDANGIPYTKENMSNLKPDELVEIIVAVCMELVKIKVDIISDDEKKN